MHELGQYIVSLCAAGILCSLLISISSRQGSHRKMISFLCGISMVITAASQWVTIRFADITAFTNHMQIESSDAVRRGQEYAKDTFSDIIKSRTETYILNKATELGLQVKVEVELSKDSPSEFHCVYIRGAAGPYAKSRLTDYISSTLGIAKENQIWT